jgi:hypothetical protein
MPTKPRTNPGAAKRSFTMRALWRLACWGGVAGAALSVAVLAGRTEVGSDRVQVAIASLSGRPSQISQAAAQVARRSFDAEGETKRLSDAVRILATDRDRLTTRLTALEQNLDDVTGSVTKELAAARAAAVKPASTPWPSDEVPAVTPPDAIATTIAAVPPSLTGLPAVVPGVAPSPVVGPSEPPAVHTDYAVDIGSGNSIESLRVRWNSIKFIRAFEGLQPLVTFSDNQKTNKVELRLVVGPLPNEAAAVQLCSALAQSRILCQPTMYDGHRMALR